MGTALTRSDHVLTVRCSGVSRRGAMYPYSYPAATENGVTLYVGPGGACGRGGTITPPLAMVFAPPSSTVSAGRPTLPPAFAPAPAPAPAPTPATTPTSMHAPAPAPMTTKRLRNV